MVIVLHRDIRPQEKHNLRDFLLSRGFKVKEIYGEEETILGAVGAIQIDKREVEQFPGVDRVIPITKPYKLASREFKKTDTVISIGPVKIGGNRIAVIAGPCAVESREQILKTAEIVRASGAVMLRGGAFKPRTSPYAFQGLKEEGLQYLKEAGEKVGLPVVSEIVNPGHSEMMSQYVDVFQIGARNMQNFELLKAVGNIGKPVILKRGLSATIQEWLMAAEYLLAHGTDDVILCERGIRTFETYTRNTLDISAVPAIKKLSHLPIIIDPSHATGFREKVPSMSLAAVAAGADGLIIEVHPNPEFAQSDGPQSLYPIQFEKMMRDIEVLTPVVGKEVEKIPRIVPQSVKKTSLKTEGALTVGFQGEHGANSEIAVHKFYKKRSDVEAVSYPNFREVFEALLKGDIKRAVLPIENTLMGSIHENYDLILQYPDIQICGEVGVRIVHCLIAPENTKIEDITRVYSQPQALAQCDHFFDTYPHMKSVPFYDTAGSVAHIAKEGKTGEAAIASPEAAMYYGMEILKEGIETNTSNYTRFLVLAREESTLSEDTNTAGIVFSVSNRPGSLFNCLKVFSDYGLNMKKLESRPILGKPWEYMFYVDVEIGENSDSFEFAIEVLKRETDSVRILGFYKSMGIT